MHANVFGYAMSHYNRDSQAIFTDLKITIYGLHEERTFKGYRVAGVCALNGEYKSLFNGKDARRVKVSYARSNAPKH
jgi:hypothetical protein